MRWKARKIVYNFGEQSHLLPRTNIPSFQNDYTFLLKRIYFSGKTYIPFGKKVYTFWLKTLYFFGETYIPFSIKVAYFHKQLGINCLQTQSEKPFLAWSNAPEDSFSINVPSLQIQLHHQRNTQFSVIKYHGKSRQDRLRPARTLRHMPTLPGQPRLQLPNVPVYIPNRSATNSHVFHGL